MLFMLAATLGFSPEAFILPEGSGVVSYCQQLSPLEACEYINSLAADGRLKELKAIYQSDFVFSHWAAGATARILPATEAVAFCRCFSLGSRHWKEAICSLYVHPKGEVLPYLLEMIRSDDAQVRACCYILCLKASWFDLIAFAEADKNVNEELDFLNRPSDELTLGALASKYLRCYLLVTSSRSN